MYNSALFRRHAVFSTYDANLSSTLKQMCCLCVASGQHPCGVKPRLCRTPHRLHGPGTQSNAPRGIDSQRVCPREPRRNALGSLLIIISKAPSFAINCESHCSPEVKTIPSQVFIFSPKVFMISLNLRFSLWLLL